MSANIYQLIITSVGQTLFDGEVVSTTLPGADGVLTILAHHEPIVTTLIPGTITVRTSEQEPREFSIREGVLEFSKNVATVLL